MRPELSHRVFANHQRSFIRRREILQRKIRDAVAEMVYVNDLPDDFIPVSMWRSQGETLRVINQFAQRSWRDAASQPRGEWGKYISSMKSRAGMRQEEFVARGVIDARRLPCARVNQTEQTVVGAYEIMPVGGDDEWAAGGTYAGVNDGEMDGAAREAPISRRQRESSAMNVLWWKVVRDVRDGD